MRLIDADEFKEIIVTYGKAGFAALRINKICELIDSQTTAYDVDKVVEQLEQQKNQYFRRSDEIKNRFGENFESHRLFSKACSYDNAIQIVKSGGIE